MKKIIVLGGGRIGTAIARDLQKDFDVTVADAGLAVLEKIKTEFAINTIQLDVTDSAALKNTLKNFDLVVSAVPGFLGFRVLKDIISSCKDVVDISFFSEDPFELNAVARKNGVTAVIDCGVAPGLCNILLGHHLEAEKVESYTCYVGGLPVKRIKPFEYKAPFSPIDVIEEYTRPSRMRINGRIETKEALSETELISFEETGELEAFNTDGLRSLLTTTNVRNMKEKTLRYPGHASLMKIFRQTGFFSSEAILAGGKEITPLDVTAELLFRHWKPEENDVEFTIMNVVVESAEKIHNYVLYDKTDQVNKMSSMARTTGFTCTSVVQLLASGIYSDTGIIGPEFLGQDQNCFDRIMTYLKNRGVNVKYNVINK